MAKINTIKIAIWMLFLFFVLAKSRQLLQESDTPSCETFYSVQEGDTCFDIAKARKLTGGLFISLNPNLDCDKLFVKQWLCVDGSP